MGKEKRKLQRGAYDRLIAMYEHSIEEAEENGRTKFAKEQRRKLKEFKNQYDVE